MIIEMASFLSLSLSVFPFLSFSLCPLSLQGPGHMNCEELSQELKRRENVVQIK